MQAKKASCSSSHLRKYDSKMCASRLSRLRSIEANIHAGHDGHDHNHDHGHGVGHSHGHAPKDFGWAFAVGTSLNIGIVLLEAVFGILSNSTVIIAR